MRSMTDFGSNSKRESSSNGGEDTNPTTTSSTRLKDPRIVRVSRAFGGKDRHSKVCTVRGLRDRRVRLSVPTAIQLYDLQERLGLNQPSKVVDWLLHAARHEIDELPPLQIPPGIMLSSHSDHAGKFKDAAGERNDHHHHHQSWMRDDDEEERHEQLDLHRQQNQNHHVSFSSLMSSSSSSSSFGRWDPSSLTLSSQTNPIPISLGLTAHHQHQELQHMVYQSAGMMMTQPYLMAPTNAAFDAARAFSFNMAADRHPSQSNNNGGNQQSKRDDLHPT